MIKKHQKIKPIQLTDKNSIAKAVHHYVNENKDYLWKRLNYILLKKVLLEWEETNHCSAITQDYLKDFIYKILRDDVVGLSSSTTIAIEHDKLAKQFEKYKKQVKNSKQNLKEKIIKLQQKTTVYQQIGKKYYQLLNKNRKDKEKNVMKYIINDLQHQINHKQQQLVIFSNQIQSRHQEIRTKHQQIVLYKSIIVRLVQRIRVLQMNEDRALTLQLCRKLQKYRADSEKRDSSLLDYRHQIQKLRQDNINKQVQINQHIQTINKLTKHKQQLQYNIGQLGSRQTQLKQQYTSLQNINKQLIIINQQYKESNVLLNSECEQLKYTNHQITNVYQQNNNNQQQLSTNNQQLSNQIQQLKGIITNKQQLHHAQVQQLTIQNTQLNEDIRQVQKNNEQLQQNIKDKQTQIQQLQSTMNNQHQQIQRIKSELREVHDGKAIVDVRVQQLQECIDTTNNKRDNNKQINNILNILIQPTQQSEDEGSSQSQQESSQSQQDSPQLIQKLNILNKQIEDKQNKLKQYEHIIYQYNAYISTNFNECYNIYSSLVPQLQSSKMETTTLKSIISSQNQHIQELQQEVEKAKVNYRISMNQYTQVHKRLSLLQNINNSLQTQLDSLKDCSKCIELSERVQELQKINAQLQETIEYANSLFITKSKEISPQKSFQSQTYANSDSDISTINIPREGVDRGTVARYLLQFIDKDNKEDKKISILNTLCDTLKIQGEQYRKVEEYVQRKKVEYKLFNNSSMINQHYNDSNRTSDSSHNGEEKARTGNISQKLYQFFTQ